jgi:hypothetical protein
MQRLALRQHGRHRRQPARGLTLLDCFGSAITNPLFSVDQPNVRVYDVRSPPFT